MTNATHLPAGTTDIPHAPPPHLGDPFETEQQQHASGRLGMWLFLGTELLMFGGLFCAYGVYRYNYSATFAYAQLCLERSMNDIGNNSPAFAYAHRYFGKILDSITTIKMLAGISTIVLISSSFTMAWGVRCAQLGKRAGLILCMILTLLGGLGFMGIRYLECRQAWNQHLGVGPENRFHKDFKGPVVPEPKEPAVPVTGDEADVVRQGPPDLDPLAATPDEPRIKSSFLSPVGIVPSSVAPEPAGRHVGYRDLDAAERARLSTFFSIYFLLTGFYGLHLLIGMVLIALIMLRAINRRVSPTHSGPVALVGLYWHLMSLIWIFLFPLLYLIH